jgi:hypothetical protein
MAAVLCVSKMINFHTDFGTAVDTLGALLVPVLRNCGGVSLS